MLNVISGAIIMWLLCCIGIIGLHWILGDIVMVSWKSITGLWLLTVFWWSTISITSHSKR